MAWITVLEQEQVEIKVDDAANAVMLEVNSGGAIPSYITVRLETMEQIDELLHGLAEAKKRLVSV